MSYGSFSVHALKHILQCVQKIMMTEVTANEGISNIFVFLREGISNY
jgi:hypothetical protein